MAVRAADKITLAVLPSPTAVKQYFLLQSSTLGAPSVPTTNPPTGGWSTVEPTYTAGATTTLYTVMLTEYGTVAYAYGPVQKSSSFEAAKQAYNLANTAVGNAQTALNTANSKNKSYFSTSAATGTTGFVDGDIWYQKSGANIIAQWEFVSGAWASRTLSSSVIANLDAGKITAGILNAGAVTISTNGTTGQRVQLDNTGLKGYDASGALKTSVGTDGTLSAVDALMTGVYRTATSGRRIEISPSTLTSAGYVISDLATVSFIYRDTETSPADSSYPAGTVNFKTYDAGLSSYIDDTRKVATSAFIGPTFSQGVTSPSGAGAGAGAEAGALRFYQKWTGDGTTYQQYEDGENVTELKSSDILITSTDDTVGNFDVDYTSGVRGITLGSSSAITVGPNRVNSTHPIISIGASDTNKPLTLTGSTVGIKGATTVDGSLTVTGAASAPTLAATTSVSAPRFQTGTRQYSVPEVASVAARNALFTSPVNGDRCYRSDVGWEEAYFSATLAGTAGWYPTAGKMPMVYYESNGNNATSGTYMVLPITTIANAGSTVLTRAGNVITVNLSGFYDVSIQALWGTNTTGSRGVHVYLNGSPFPAPVRASGVFADDTGVALTSRVFIAAGSQITAVTRQSSGATLGVAGRFGITWVMPGVAPS